MADVRRSIAKAPANPRAMTSVAADCWAACLPVADVAATTAVVAWADDSAADADWAAEWAVAADSAAVTVSVAAIAVAWAVVAACEVDAAADCLADSTRAHRSIAKAPAKPRAMTSVAADCWADCLPAAVAAADWVVAADVAMRAATPADAARDCWTEFALAGLLTAVILAVVAATWLRPRMFPRKPLRPKRLRPKWIRRRTLALMPRLRKSIPMHLSFRTVELLVVPVNSKQ